MKIKHFGFLFLTFFFVVACSRSTQTAALAGKSAASITTPGIVENSLLWKISGKNLAKPSYLFGTIHLIPKKYFVLTDATQKSFSEAKRITFEINMDEMNDMSTQLSLLSGAMMKGDTTLKTLLTNEEYLKVQKKFDKMGLPMFLFERIKPMFLSTFLANDMKPDDLSSGKMMSYEMELAELAKKRKKEMGGLETAAFQLSLFDAIPYHVQAKMLVDALDSNDNGEDELKKLVELYTKQDINAMQTLMKEDTTGFAQYEDKLLTNRNKNWIATMTQMMSEKSTFFAVGAGHLGGKNGVITLLRQAGYQVTAIK